MKKVIIITYLQGRPQLISFYDSGTGCDVAGGLPAYCNMIARIKFNSPVVPLGEKNKIKEMIFFIWSFIALFIDPVPFFIDLY